MTKKKHDSMTNLGMLELIQKFPKALTWGLPELITKSELSRAGHAGLLDMMQRGDTSSQTVFVALATAYDLPNFNEQARSEWIDELSDYLELCLKEFKLSTNPWGLLIVGVEIPSVLSQVCPENSKLTKNFKRAASLLSDSSDELFDENGLINGRHFPRFAAIMAVWARCFYGGRKKSLNLKLKKAFVNRFEWAVRQLLSLSGGDRHITTLSEEGKLKLSKEFVELLLFLGGDSSDRRLAAQLGYPQKEFKKRVADHYLPECSLHSEESQIAVLRTGWGLKRREAYVRYSGHEVWAELRSSGKTLFSCQLATHVTVAGEALAVVGTWEEVCYESDEDVDYLELEAILSDGWRIQKQFLLTKDDNLLLIGDAVLPGKSRAKDAGGDDLCLEQRYTLADGIKYFGADEHNEGYLWGENPEAVVFPLALSEWRLGNREGELTVKQQVLSYRVTKGQHRAVYAPLLFVLNGKAATKKYTWRRLSVAEELDRQTEDIAAGFRIQVGKRQWLLYRSLTEFGNRTLLGQNYSSEFAFGEFQEDGTVYEYVEIE